MKIFNDNLYIPEGVFNAALTLHQKNSRELLLSPFSVTPQTHGDSDSLWRCTDDQIEFINLEARNHCVAVATFQQLMPLNGTDALFGAAIRLWREEIGHPDFASGRLLGLANSAVNVLTEVAKAIRGRKLHHDELDVFDFLHLVEVTLPHLPTVAANDLVALIDAQYEATKLDMARGLIYHAIEKRLQLEPQTAWEVCQLTKEKMSESMQGLYSTAMQALMHTEQQTRALKDTLQDAEDDNLQIAQAAVWMVGRAIQVHQLGESDLNACIEVLVNKLNSMTLEIQQVAIRAVAHASLKDERLMLELVRLAEEKNDYTLSVVADFLFENQQKFSMSSPYLKPLLQSLIWLSPVNNKAAVENFDWVLYGLYPIPEHKPLVLDCLKQWIVKHGSTSINDESLTRLFDRTIKQIANDKSNLEKLITHWLLASERQLAVACFSLINYLYIGNIKSLAFSKEVLDTLDMQDFQLLVRRLLGYVTSKELLLSLVFSLVDTENAHERSFGWVFSLLIEEVGRDYQHATMEALKTRIEKAGVPEKEFLEQMYAMLQQRHTANDDLPILQELRPPMRLRRAIALNHARLIERMRDSSNENSIAHLLFTKVSLKAGVASFSVHDNKVGPTQHLQTVSHSVSLPLRALTDPVGYTISGIQYRLSKRENK